MHHTKSKGDLGVLKAMADVHAQGYQILNPMSEHLPFDFVAYDGERFVRIQVKHRKLVNGKIELLLKTGWNDKQGYHPKRYDMSSIDVFCLFCPENDQCYYISAEELNNRSYMCLRVVESVRQHDKSNDAKKYRIMRP